MRAMNTMKTIDRQAGFTLIEMLVAMGITLVLVIATLGVFDSATRANEAATQLANMNQNLRVGMNLMVRDFLQTGQGIPTGGIPIPNGLGAGAINRPNPPNWAALTFPVTYTTLPAVAPGAGLGPQNANTLGVATDMVNILYGDATLALVSTNAVPNSQFVAISENGSQITVDPSNPISGVGVNNPIVPGDLILVTSPTGSRIQAVTDVRGQQITFNAGDVFNLNQRGAPSGSILDLRIGGVFPANTFTAIRVNMISYYLNTTARLRIPRLMRQYNFQPARSVAEVIENVQLSYDFVDGVTNPTDQKTVPVGLSENQIRKVNLFLSGRSDQLYSLNQQYFRNSLETQVSLRSLAFINQYKSASAEENRDEEYVHDEPPKEDKRARHRPGYGDAHPAAAFIPDGGLYHAGDDRPGHQRDRSRPDRRVLRGLWRNGKNDRGSRHPFQRQLRSERRPGKRPGGHPPGVPRY
jgi:prepilin-type N-terminal cleavage/methylation domain-containing protein